MTDKDEINDLYGSRAGADSAYWKMRKSKSKNSSQRISLVSKKQILERQNSELVRLVKDLGINVDIALSDVADKRYLLNTIYGEDVRELPDLYVGRRLRDKYRNALD